MSSENINQDQVDSSSSFDSTNSFYSTDSSSSASSLPMDVEILDEDKLGGEYKSQIRLQVSKFINEVNDDSLFQSMLDLPAVKVDTSVNPATPFCFRTSADFKNVSALDAFALFVDVGNRGQWDAMCHSIRILKVIDPLTFIYHLQLKATWPTAPRDSLALVAFRKLADGRFVSVAWSIHDDSLCPPDPAGKFIRMHTRISANLFTPTPTGFRLNQLIDGDPKGNIPSYIIKKVSAKSFPDTIEAINKVIQSKKPVTFDYNLLVSGNKDDTENIEEIAALSNNPTISTPSPSHVLHDLTERLAAIEDQLRSQSHWQIWAPLAISSVSLLLLMNLNFRKK